MNKFHTMVGMLLQLRKIFSYMFVILEREQILNTSHHKNFVNSPKGVLKNIPNMKPFFFFFFFKETTQISGTEYLSGERYISLALWGIKEATTGHFCHLFLCPIIFLSKTLGWSWLVYPSQRSCQKLSSNGPLLENSHFH